MCKVDSRDVWFTPLHAVCKRDFFFSRCGGNLSKCIPCAKDSFCIRSLLSLSPWEPVPRRHWASWLQLPERTRGLSWESAGHRAMELCIMLHQHCFSASPSGQHRKGSSYCSSHEGRKKKSFWTEGWNRLAGLSGLVPHITNDLIDTHIT